MPWYSERIQRFRQLPTPFLLTHVSSRFVFGLGLGATLAGKGKWRRRGLTIMALATALAVPGARRILAAAI